jgi:polyhydroxybutyrate depolymerase
MKTVRQAVIVFLVAMSAHVVLADEAALKARSWDVDGTPREGLVYAPSSSEPAPVVFAFHGHGGTMNQASRSFRYHELWPQAIVVYLQGLKTPGKLTDPEGKRAGWQHAVGDQGDRDLKFFDVVLESLKRDYKVDARRIYSTGHSNGGGFTYLLWTARGDTFAAVAPSSAAGRQFADGIRPKPVLHVAGENDTLVKFEWQRTMMDRLLAVNQCEKEGTEFAPYCTLYPSKIDTPVALYIHPGTHKFPEEAPAVIVKFFKMFTKP